jgi:hypothetical protein
MVRCMSDDRDLEPIRAIDGPADAQVPPGRAKALDVPVQSREAFVRRRGLQLDDGSRRIILMERMIGEFNGMAADLDREILIEQERAGIHDPAHFAYPTYAKAAMLRRDNLRRSAEELEAQLAKTKEALLAMGVAA